MKAEEALQLTTTSIPLPHAVTQVGSTSYAYDANGNMTTRGSQTITWDVENHPVTVSGNGTATFVYDGDGNRIKKIEGGETILYINRYFEVNLTASENTSYYYLGDRLVAMSENSTLRYMHQDHLTGTALVTSDNGTQVGYMKYYPFGETRSGSVPTDKLFTGQRLDDTGLYYYGARYYDPTIGRFISPDSIVPDPTNPQAFNRYSYCLNNPLKYIDPTGCYDLAALYDYYGSMYMYNEPSVPSGYAEIGGGYVNIATFVGWVESTPDNSLDYVSMGESSNPIDRFFNGPELYYHENPRSEPVLMLSSPASVNVWVDTLPRGIGQGTEIISEVISKAGVLGLLGLELFVLLLLQGDTNPNIIMAEKQKNVTPDQNPRNYRNWRDAKVNEKTGEVWKKDKGAHGGPHYEVYKNKKAYEKGIRDRSVWPDGRIKDK